MTFILENMSKNRILIVEDDLGIQTLTKFCLEMENSWEISIAVNGEEGLSKAKAIHPDVIFFKFHVYTFSFKR